MRVRRAVLQAARERGDTDIVIASLSRPPRTLFATDLETDPNNFRNQCMREYYQVRSIRLGNPTTPWISPSNPAWQPAATPPKLCTGVGDGHL